MASNVRYGCDTGGSCRRSSTPRAQRDWWVLGPRDGRYQFIKIIPREVFVIGREAVMVWTINGLTPEGAVSFDGVDLFHFDEGDRITSVRAFWQRASLHRQLVQRPQAETTRE